MTHIRLFITTLLFTILPLSASATLIEIDFRGTSFSLTQSFTASLPASDTHPYHVSGRFLVDTSLMPSPVVGGNGSVGYVMNESNPWLTNWLDSDVKIFGVTLDPMRLDTLGETIHANNFLSFDIPSDYGRRSVLGSTRLSEAVVDGNTVQTLASFGIGFNNTPSLLDAVLSGSQYDWQDDGSGLNAGSFQFSQSVISDLGASITSSALLQFNLDRLFIRPQASVPEPSAISLLAAGLGLVAIARIRRRHTDC